MPIFSLKGLLGDMTRRAVYGYISVSCCRLLRPLQKHIICCYLNSVLLERNPTLTLARRIRSKSAFVLVGRSCYFVHRLKLYFHIFDSCPIMTSPTSYFSLIQISRDARSIYYDTWDRPTSVGA